MSGWTVAASALSAIGPSGKYLQYRQQQKNFNEQKYQNERDRQHQIDMYNQQRSEYLLDQKNANEYNSPMQQMQRLREAELNPHLMYGSPTLAAKSADVASASPTGSNQPAAKVDYSNMGIDGESLFRLLLMHANTENTQANTENLKTQNELMQYDKELKSIGITSGGIKNQTDELNLNKQIATYDMDVKKAQLDNEKLAADIAGRNASTTYTLAANERAELANSTNIKKTLQDIIESKMRVAKSSQEIQNLEKALELLEKEGTIKDWEIALQKAGITKGGGEFANAASILATLWKNLLNQK